MDQGSMDPPLWTGSMDHFHGPVVVVVVVVFIFAISVFVHVSLFKKNCPWTWSMTGGP